MPDRAISVPQATQIAQATKRQLTELNGRLTPLDGIDEAFNENVSSNVFNGTLNPGILRLNGTVAASADYAYTDKIPVTSATFIVTADSISNHRRLNIPVRFLVAYDQNENVLENYGQQSIGSDNSYIDTDGANIITVNENVKFVALTLYRSETKYENISVSFNTSETEYEPYGKTLTLKGECLPDIINHVLYEKLHGKTIAVFGDSIMYGAGSDAKGPADLIAEKYGMELAKYCVSGSTMGVRTDSPDYTVDEAHHIAKQVRNAISANIKPDVIVFNGGTNDIGGNITIGEMSEVYTAPASETYFANGFETVAYLLKSNYPGIPMIYMRAHNMSSRSYTGQISYGELGNRIAEKWGIRTADMYKRMNTQLDAERTRYLADYTHPNAAGYKRFYIPGIEEVLYMLPI